MKALTWLLVWFLFWSLSSVFVVQTWFVADEYWQSIEIAHLQIFKYGYSTWEWHYGLRSYSFPLMFTTLYYVLKVTALDSTFLVVYVPRFAQAVLSAVGLWYSCRLSGTLFGCSSVPWTAAALSCSWVLYYCASRTLYNTTETSLTMIALYYYSFVIFQNKKVEKADINKTVWIYLIIAAVTAIIRPTAIIIWIPLCVAHIYRSFRQQKGWTTLVPYFVIGIFAALTQLVVDSLNYGQVTFTPYNFFKFNVFSGLSAHYGTHPWHWYISQGLPILLTTHLIPFVLSVWRRPFNPLNLLILWIVVAYSALGHKEFRFILPTVTMAACVIGDYLASLAKDRTKRTFLTWKPQSVLLCLLCVSNIPMAAYFGLVHQRGTLDVMEYLAKVSSNVDAEKTRIFFLMPCHSTPYYSHIHQNVSLDFLTCEPNLDFAQNYEDEADQFYQHPIPWLSSRFDLHKWGLNLSSSSITNSYDVEFYTGKAQLLDQLPTHIVMFDVLFPQVNLFLTVLQYTKCAEFFHAHFLQGRVGGTVQIFCLPSVTNKVKLND